MSRPTSPFLVAGMVALTAMFVSPTGAANPMCKLKIVWEDVTINQSNGEVGAEQWYFETSITVGGGNEPNPGVLKVPPSDVPGWTYRHPPNQGTLNPPTFPTTITVNLAVYEKGTVLDGRPLALSFKAVANEEDAFVNDRFANAVHETRDCLDSSDGDVWLPVNNGGGSFATGNIDTVFHYSVTFG